MHTPTTVPNAGNANHAGNADSPADAGVRAPRVLIIDDEAMNRMVLSRMLGRAGFLPVEAADGPAGREMATRHAPDIILLDIMMPGESGFETLERLMRNPRTMDTPVVLISALDAVEDKVRGFDAGAVDYVTKPFQGREVLARIRTHIKLARAKNALIGEQAQRLSQVASAQRDLLTTPEEMPAARFASCYRPVLEAGGDFYDVFETAGGHGYLVADIAGHDLSASFVTSSLKALVAQNTGPLFTPQETFKNINSVLHQVLKPGRHLTAAMVTLDESRRRATCVCAGHPAPVVVRAGGTVEELVAEGDILGPFPTIYVEPVSCELAPGDRIYLYTDGLVEHFDKGHAREPGSMARGVSNLHTRLLQAHDQPLDRAVTTTCDALLAHTSQQDDVVLLGTEA